MRNNLHGGMGFLAFVILFLVILIIFTTGLHFVTRQNNLGSDFYVFWLAGRAALFQHSSPYSPEIAHQAQMAILHRPALPGEDQLAFAYPPYILLASLPAFWMSYDWAQAFWMALILMGLVSTIFIVFQSGKPPFLALSLLLFYPFVFGIILGNFVILIGVILLLVLGLVLMQENRHAGLQVICGLLLAWASAKPQVTWLFILFILIFSVRRQLWGLFTSFFANLGIFFLVSFLIYPAWYVEWLPAVQNYAAYNFTKPLIISYLARFLPPDLASWIGILLMGAVLLITAALFVRWWRGKHTTLQLTAWCGFVVFLFHPSVHSYEQVVFLLPLALWFFLSEEAGSKRAVLTWIGWIILSWAALVLSYTYHHVAVDGLPFLAYSAWLLSIMGNLQKKKQRRI